MAQGKTLACVTSAQVAHLARQATILGTKLKATVVLLLGLTVMAAGAGVFFSPRPAPGEPKAQPAPPPKAPSKKIAQDTDPHGEKNPRLDLHGDPLPEGALARFGTVRFRHADGADSLALSPDDRVLATEGSGTIRVWDAASGKPRHVFRFRRRAGGFGAGQELLTSSPDGPSVARRR